MARYQQTDDDERRTTYSTTEQESILKLTDESYKIITYKPSGAYIYIFLNRRGQCKRPAGRRMGRGTGHVRPSG